MLIGLIGAPNKGKSTIFSAMTSVDAQIADYAFTTIKPNLGVAYATRKCPDTDLGIKCTPRNSACKNGVRSIPVNIIDVAGLVPGAHLGKGMGNQFLNDLIAADALIQVVDISGRTDVDGTNSDYSDPSLEIGMIRDEMAEWLAGIITRHMPKLSKRNDGEAALLEVLSGLKAGADQIRAAAGENYLTLSNINWSGESTKAFASSLLRINKPIIVAANKMDLGSDEKLGSIRSRLGDMDVVPCSGAVELALSKAAGRGIIDYCHGGNDFGIISEASAEQRVALGYMQEYVKRHNGTGVQELLNRTVFGLLDSIVVYPVEDESHYADRSGNVLPDAILMKNGGTAYNLAERIHTDIAKGMKYAVDARTKARLQKDYVLGDGDIVKIVTH